MGQKNASPPNSPCSLQFSFRHHCFSSNINFPTFLSLGCAAAVFLLFFIFSLHTVNQRTCVGQHENNFLFFFRFSRFRMRTGLGFSYVQRQKTSKFDEVLFRQHFLEKRSSRSLVDFLDFLRAFFLRTARRKRGRLRKTERGSAWHSKSNIDHQLDWTVWLILSSRVATITFLFP